MIFHRRVSPTLLLAKQMLWSYEHWRYTLARAVETQQKFEKYLKFEAPAEQIIS